LQIHRALLIQEKRNRTGGYDDVFSADGNGNFIGSPAASQLAKSGAQAA